MAKELEARESDARMAYAKGWHDGEKAGAEGVEALADRLERYRVALENLLGQVEQARDGFGVYRSSDSMDAAVAEARQALEAK